MRFTARTRLLIAALATAAGLALVVAFGWRVLDEVTDESAHLKSGLSRLMRIEKLEEEIHELAAGSPGASVRNADRLYDELRRIEMDAEERAMWDRLGAHLEAAKTDGSSQTWAVAAESLSDIGRHAVEIATKSAALTTEPAASGARDILKLGAMVACVCGVLAAFALVRHLRERREAEAQLRRSDRLAALGTMAASVAHEINNPLATISGCASAVRDRLGASSASHTDEIEYLGMILDETKRCTGIVRSLRDLARDTPPAMAPFDLAALAREVVALVQMSRDGPRIEWQVSGEPSLEAVCDPDKVKQLLLNLLVNARDASPDGGSVRIVVRRDGESAAELVVEDQGRGIAPDDLPRVFEPFHTGKTRGLGLGLFVCERIASLHGGSIVAASDGPGRGARFTVTIPLQPPAAGGRPA